MVFQTDPLTCVVKHQMWSECGDIQIPNQWIGSMREFNVSRYIRIHYQDHNAS